MNTELIEKIQKLMAKAESSTFDAEAEAFIKKAQKLMAQNNLEMRDIQIKLDEEGEVIEGEGIAKSMCTRHVRLAKIIANNFRVKVIYKSSKGLYFVGLEQDVKIAELTFTGMNNFMEKKRSKIYREARKEGRDTKNIREHYCMGFLDGISEALNRQVYCLSLVVTTPKAVIKYMNDISMYLDEKKARGPVITQVEADIYNKGYNDGKGYGTQIEE